MGILISLKKINHIDENESHSVTSDSANPWSSLGQNTEVGSRFFLQGIFPTQGSLPHCRQILY